MRKKRCPKSGMKDKNFSVQNKAIELLHAAGGGSVAKWRH
jgi:hypothetical protein